MSRDPRSRLIIAILALGALLGGAGCETTAVSPMPVASLPTEYTGETFAPSSFVARPIPLSAGPDYRLPERAPNHDITLRARIEYVVDTAGRVAAARIISTNAPAHAQQVLRWLETARFVPGRKDETAVAVRIEQDFDVVYGPVRDP